MKNIVKITSVVALLALTGMKGIAQEKQQSATEKRAAKMTEHMTESLELSADQVAKVKELNTKMVEKKTAIHEENMKKRREARQQYEADLKSVLTESQYQKHQETRENRVQHNKQKHHGNRPHHHDHH